jgi:hypothetical protein
MGVPTISVEVNPDRDAEVFFNFLHSTRFPQHRNLILREYPALKKIEEGNGGVITREDVRSFLREKYAELSVPLEAIVAKIETELFTKTYPAITELAKLMQYTWSAEFPGYTAILTLRPGSPFTPPYTFYYSAVRELRGEKDRLFSFVATHEISHLILLAILEDQQTQLASEEHDADMRYFLRELLAPALMNQPSLKELTEISSGYRGNPDLHDINVAAQGGVMQVSDYFTERLSAARQSETYSFRLFLDDMVDTLRSMQAELLARKSLWNAHGMAIRKNPSLLSQYAEPIIIRRPVP